MAQTRALIAGNWKMHGRRADLAAIPALAGRLGPAPGLDVVICPPFTLLSAAAEAAAGGPIEIGAQDCRAGDDGAFTGDVNPSMLEDAGCAYVIVGHSERRAGHGETDALVRAKAQAAQAAGLTPIVCVGETREQREAGEALAVIVAQTAAAAPSGGPLVLAYEPVWAIGSGLTPTIAEIEAAHAAIRGALVSARGAEGEADRILYGGSVKPANAASVFGARGVDGALVGGASLKVEDFFAIISAHPAFGGS